MKYYEEAISTSEVSLDYEQEQAISDMDSKFVVYACPGAGKTRVLVTAINRLVEQGISGQDILVVAFSNNSANVLHERVNHNVSISTLHSFAMGVLRKNDDLLPVVMDGDVVCNDFKSKIILAKLIKNKPQLSVAELLLAFSNAKNKLMEGPDGGWTTGDLEMDKVFKQYEAEKDKRGEIDFADMLVLCLELFEKYPHVCQQYKFKYVFVDETQDLSPLAHELISKLVDNRLCMASDLKQSIYGWAGVDFDLLSNIQQIYPNINKKYLKKNYRSTQEIVEIGNAVAKDIELPDPAMESISDIKGEVSWWGHYPTMSDEAKDIVDAIESTETGVDDIMCIYRVNWYSLFLELEMMNRKIPYFINGGASFFKQPEIRDMLMYIRLSQNIDDKEAIMAIVNRPHRSLGYNTWKSQFQTALSSLSTIEALQKQYRLRQRTSYFAAKNSQEKLIDHLNILQLFNRPIDVIRFVRSEMKYDKWLMKEKTGGEMGGIDLTQALDMFSLFISKLSMKEFSDLRLGEEADEQKGVKLSTVHMAKGDERKWVHIAGLTNEIFPHIRNSVPGEELRLFYVAVTRAMERLTCSSASTLQSKGPSKYTQYLKIA